MYSDSVLFKGRYLEKVTKLEDEIKSMSVLLNPKAGNGERFGLVSTLTFYDYSFDEIIDIVFSNAKWEKMDKQRTIIEARKVYDKKRRIMSGELGIHTPTNSQNKLTLSVEDLITLFWSEARPVPKMTIASDPSFAAWMYHKNGYHVVPKDAKGKFPSIKWKEYMDRKPTDEEIEAWDWSHGLCLVATKDLCFLDIDFPYEQNWKGHYERTPRGGVHVFGRGNAINRKINGIGEIKGHNTLIVAYPTVGYKI